MGHYYISDTKYENKIKTLIGNKGIFKKKKQSLRE